MVKLVTVLTCCLEEASTLVAGSILKETIVVVVNYREVVSEIVWVGFSITVKATAIAVENGIKVVEVD